MSERDLIAHFVDGKETESVCGRRFDNVDPWTRSVRSEVSSGDADDVARAVASASDAFRNGEWPRMTHLQRGRVLVRLADLMEQHIDELALADTRDMGRPISVTRAVDVPRAAAMFRFFADHARLSTAEVYPTDDAHHIFTRFEPAGVVAAISPWNFPLLLEAWKVAPALAWGNTVVLKPAEDSPTSALVMAALAIEAGLPPGVLNVVQGPGATAGRALSESAHVQRMSFTGSTETGRSVAGAAARNVVPVSLELGGKNANLVFADADIEAAVAWSIKGIFGNSGQVCLSGSRIYVQAAVFEDFTARFVAAAEELRLGDPLDPSTELGPLASHRHFEKVSHYFDLVSDEGGKVLTGGPGEGWSFRPTVITDVGAGSRISSEEIFGPIVTLTAFNDELDALELANSTPYGLTALVFTRDLSRAHRVAAALRTGVVWVNCYQIRDLRAPFGGFGHSGIGRDGGSFSRDFLTEPKTVTMELA